LTFSIDQAIIRSVTEQTQINVADLSLQRSLFFRSIHKQSIEKIPLLRARRGSKHVSTVYNKDIARKLRTLLAPTIPDVLFVIVTVQLDNMQLGRKTAT
jgi:hypothetical protein